MNNCQQLFSISFCFKGEKTKWGTCWRSKDSWWANPSWDLQGATPQEVHENPVFTQKGAVPTFDEILSSLVYITRIKAINHVTFSWSTHCLLPKLGFRLQLFYGFTLLACYPLQKCCYDQILWSKIKDACLSAFVPEILKFEKWVKYANEMTDDIIHSTKYYIKYTNSAIFDN